MGCCTSKGKMPAPFEMKFWASAGIRIEKAVERISLDDGPAWDSFWEVELARQGREYRAELMRGLSCEARP